MKRNQRAYHNEKENHIGVFRKWSGLGCKKEHCLMCHYDKHMGLKKADEIKADFSMKEQLEELEIGKELE